MTSERWLPVVGYEDIYEVSDRGRVRSVDRIIIHPRNRWGNSHEARRKGKVLKLARMKRKDGQPSYLYAKLCRDTKADHRTVQVHLLVLEAFVGPRPAGQQCAHNDGDMHNNHLSNLRWTTPKDNHFDKRRHGTH